MHVFFPTCSWSFLLKRVQDIHFWGLHYFLLCCLFFLNEYSLFLFSPFRHYFLKNWYNSTYLLGRILWKIYSNNYQSFYSFNLFNKIKESLSLHLKALPFFLSNSHYITFSHRNLSAICVSPKFLCAAQASPLNRRPLFPVAYWIAFIWRSRGPLTLIISKPHSWPWPQPPPHAASLHQPTAIPSF